MKQRSGQICSPKQCPSRQASSKPRRTCTKHWLTFGTVDGPLEPGNAMRLDAVTVTYSALAESHLLHWLRQRG